MGRRVVSCLSLLLLAVVATGDDPPVKTADEKPPERDFADTLVAATHLISECHIKVMSQAELVRLAISGVYNGVGVRLPEEIVKRLDGAKDLKREDLKALLLDARTQLGRRKELDELKDIDLALAAIFRKIEPDAIQTPQSEARDRPICILREREAGIGVELRRDRDTQMLRVATTIKDGPAYKAGVYTGDLITAITATPHSGPGAVIRTVSTKGLLPDAAEEVLMGEPDSKVRLTIRREGAERPLEIAVARGTAEPEKFFGVRRNRDDSWDHVVEPRARLGYVRITSFGRTTMEDLDRAITRLEVQGLNGLVLDLRSCPGGYLHIAAMIADGFIDDGLLFTVHRRGVPPEEHRAERGKGWLKLPLVVLVNAETKGTAEILAACLQDHRRAVILGERTAGETRVRNFVRLPDGGELRFTFVQYSRPSGKNLTKLLTSGREDEDWGVVPDKGFAVPLETKERNQLREHLDAKRIIPRPDRPRERAGEDFKDRQLETALAYLREQLKKSK